MMHKCSKHIQHEGEAWGLYVVTQEYIIPYSTYRGVLTGSYKMQTKYMQINNFNSDLDILDSLNFISYVMLDHTLYSI